MTDPFAKVRPGQPLKIPAQAYNAFIDAAKLARNVRANALVDPTREFLFGLVPIRNDSGNDLPRYGVLGIDSPLFSPDPNSEPFERRVALVGATPDVNLHQGRFAIAAEPIFDGQLGLACVGGVCIAQVYVPDDDGRVRLYADIGDGISGYLMAAERGAATILWRQDAPTGGVVWAVVRLGAAMGGPLEYEAVLTGATLIGDRVWQYDWVAIEWLNTSVYSTIAAISSATHGPAYNDLETNNSAGEGVQTAGWDTTGAPGTFDIQPCYRGIEVPVRVREVYAGDGTRHWRFALPNVFDGSCQ